MFRDIARPLADWLRSLPLHIEATALRQLPHSGPIGCKYFNILGPDGERLEFNQIL